MDYKYDENTKLKTEHLHKVDDVIWDSGIYMIDTRLTDEVCKQYLDAVDNKIVHSCQMALPEFDINKEMLSKNLLKARQCFEMEQELGCPLDVVFKALKQGYIWVYDSHYNVDDYTKTKASIKFNNDKFYIGFARNTRRLQDYGEAWWLEKPEER